MQALTAVGLVAAGAGIILLRGRLSAFNTWCRANVWMVRDPERTSQLDRASWLMAGVLVILLGIAIGVAAVSTALE